MEDFIRRLKHLIHMVVHYVVDELNGDSLLNDLRDKA